MRNATLSRKQKLLSVLDVGSAKIVCLIARLSPLSASEYLPGRTHRVEVLGFGMQQSRGIKAGVVIDMRLAEQAIRLAVDSAERMCGLVVDSVLVNFASRNQKSHHIEAQIPIDGQVGQRDMRRVLAQGSKVAFNLDQLVLHSLPISFELDGEAGISNPLDMMGEVLKVDIHAISTEPQPLRNLEQCINNAHLAVEAIVPTSLASSLSVFVGDEAKLGACCIDIGAGTTNLAIFSDNKFIHSETLPVGGGHITTDIARLLSISVEEAERLKVLHGSVLDTGVSERDLISLPSLEGEGGLPGQYPQALLTRIIRARLEDIFDMVRVRLKSCRRIAPQGMRFILTGGGAGLVGVGQMASRILGAPVRSGRPLGVSGLPEVGRGSAFSVASGLLVYPQFLSSGAYAREHDFYESEQKRGFAPLRERAAKFLKAL